MMKTKTKTHFEKYIELLRCPACQSKLQNGGKKLKCIEAGHTFPIEKGIPEMFVPKEWQNGKLDVTDTVRQFYEKTPFPNYDEFDSTAALVEKSRKGLFARLLDEQVPLGSNVLEVGCGTGQLSNFLGIAQRNMFGTDMCLNSLSLAEKFRSKNNIPHVGFYQMNLFRPLFAPETFDLVICNGVLMVTPDPLEGFKSIATLVKKGGYILIGLYNKYGRLTTDFRRLIFRFTGKRFLSLDPYLRERGGKLDAKTEAWFADQYQHPHECKHTMGQVLKWFDETGFRFVNSIPKGRFMQPFKDDEKLFVASPRADRMTLAAVQTHMILTGNREGGFFTMIGQRM